MSKSALIVATVASTIDQFCMNNIHVLEELGYDISVYANFTDNSNNTSQKRLVEFKNELIGDNIKVYDSIMERKLSKVKENIQVYKDLKKNIQSNEYTIIHCHTPIAAFITRLAARKARKRGTKVIYTAHGFHFFKGAPLKNWIIYYPIEYICAYFTDILFTINKEDFIRAKKLKSKSVEYIPGVGIDIDAIKNISVDKIKRRTELGVKDDAILVLSVGELNDNKNHKTILKAISLLNNRNIFYVLVGKDKMNGYLNNLSKELGIESQLILTGYRQDVTEICKVSDIFAFPSKREGLGLAALEAMACGLPIVASNIHGIVDYTVDGVTGYCYSPSDVEGFAEGINKLAGDRELRKKMGQYNIQAVSKFDNRNVKECLESMYDRIS